MLKTLVVEKRETRRADFVDAICELPGVEVCGAAGGLVDALRMLSSESIDAVLVGTLPPPELQQLTALVRNLLGRDVLAVADTNELLARVEALLAAEHTPDAALGERAARTEALALARAGKVALVHRLRVAQQGRSTPRGLQTLVLKDWLPAMCASFAGLMPAYVELVPIISPDTPPVRCVPEVLEHEMFDIVLDAAAKLPWGGTIWLTVELASNDTVRIDVLENGFGTRDDVTLRTAAPVSS
ncbi:MAG TPA: hypothetical protein VLT45_03465 [Kofleriaceae bacterium]|nr:hypothetical protein [Kofleriaceae bacterium]